MMDKVTNNALIARNTPNASSSRAKSISKLASDDSTGSVSSAASPSSSGKVENDFDKEMKQAASLGRAQALSDPATAASDGNAAIEMGTENESGLPKLEYPKIQKKGEEAMVTAGLLDTSGSAKLAVSATKNGISPPAETGNALKAASDRKSELGMFGERAPVTQKTAASMKTATAMTGLKPWSKDWVLEGQEPDPNLRPLFSPTDESKASKAKVGVLTLIKDPKSAIYGKSELAPNEVPKVVPREVNGMIPQAFQIGAPMSKQDLLNLQRLQNMQVQQNPLNPTRGFTGGMNPSGGLPVAGDDGLTEGINVYRLTDDSGAPLTGSYGTAPVYPGLSGSEYLNTLSSVRNDEGSRPELRMIEGGGEHKGKKGSLGDKEHSATDRLSSALSARDFLNGADLPANSARNAVTVLPAEVAGHVVKGAMSQDRLSHEALLGMSSGIRNLAPQGGGEMHVRLKPDNLGELHLKVVTSGNDVGLKIQASDERAKKILEDSLGHLKESLASQNLNLHRVQVTVGSLAGAATGNDSRSDSGFQNPQSGSQYFQDLLGQNPGNPNANSGFSGGNSPRNSDFGNGPDADYVPRRSGSGGNPAGAASLGSQSLVNGRLDVRA